MLAGWSILESVVCRAFAPLRTANDVSNNRGYVIAEYVISSRRPMLKNRKFDETVIVSTLKPSVRFNRVRYNEVLL